MKPAVTLALAFVVSAVASLSAWAAETVVVRLQNGREITATIDQRSDETRLWLQYGSRAVTVIRPVAWQQIVWASHQGSQISIARLQALAMQAETPAGPADASPRVVRVPPAGERVQAEAMANRAREALGFRRRVRAVDFDAFLANWDGDVETDGLHLRLFPIDDHGQMTVASGTLHVEFIARRRQSFNDAARQRGIALGRIGRWTVQIDEADFESGVATVKLPFQAVHPEFHTDWFADGLVHVRFAVAGDGTFEQSLDGIRVRPFSPLRDATQVQSGRHFLSTERTGRGQRKAE